MNDTSRDTARIIVYKYSASRWAFTNYNKQGGSFGTTAFPSQKAALVAATRHLDAGVTIPVTFKRWDAFTADYIITKSIHFTKGS